MLLARFCNKPRFTSGLFQCSLFAVCAACYLTINSTLSGPQRKLRMRRLGSPVVDARSGSELEHQKWKVSHRYVASLLFAYVCLFVAAVLSAHLSLLRPPTRLQRQADARRGCGRLAKQRRRSAARALCGLCARAGGVPRGAQRARAALPRYDSRHRNSV